MDFSQSRTKENLMRAFAGESQARNRYIMSAEQAVSSNMYAVSLVFRFTADQEEAHAKAFYKKLKEISDENISIDGNYPVNIYEDIIKSLRSAQHNEFQEYENDYKEFSNIAKEEGFSDIAVLFNNIANVEKTHGNRFGKIADLIEQNKLYVSDVETQWVCLNCGHILTGKKAPEKCPVCEKNRGYFIRLELCPYL